MIISRKQRLIVTNYHGKKGYWQKGSRLVENTYIHEKKTVRIKN